MKILIVCLLALINISVCLFNPGALVTIPFPLKPPQINLNLPIKIQPIDVNRLELSEISLKNLNYQWDFTEEIVTVKISDAKVFFQWTFKADKGEGTFTQTSYQIQLFYKFVQNSKGKIQIDITSTKSKLGHSAVHLGGNASQTVIVQVTDLILNHAAIIFRKTIQNAISSGIKSFASILDTDIKIFCQPALQIQNNQKCVYVNTSLVAPPIISNKTLVIQINGAPYATGQSSGQLNPDNILVKTSSNKIQLQTHIKLIQETIKKVVSIMPPTLDFQISQISDTADIYSLTVSPAFPKMAEINPPEDVIFSVKVPNLVVSFNPSTQWIEITGNTSLKVLTKNKTSSPVQYMKQCGIKFSTAVQIVYGWKSTSMRVQKLVMNELNCDQQDVHQGYVSPDNFYAAQQPLLTFLRNAFNGQLNSKLLNLQFNSIQGVLSGKLLQNIFRADLTLNSITPVPSESSSVKIILDQ